MKASFFDYVKAAFNAKPIGMIVPPNWLGLAVVGLLGIVNPGVWVLGAGLELAYLWTLASSDRFQRLVQGSFAAQRYQHWQEHMQGLLRQLPPDDQARYQALGNRCQAILRQQGAESPGIAAQGEGLGKLLWIYLRLLIARQSILKIQREVSGDRQRGSSLVDRLEDLRKKLEVPDLNTELRKSLSGQLEILQQRVAKQSEARDKLVFLEAELTRIQEQVELIREQAALSADPAAVSQRIDEISASLDGTTEWVNHQQQMLGQVEDLLVNPPPVMLPAAELKQ